MICKDFEFDLISRNDYTSLYFNEALKLAICVADEEYIPIDYFKSMFLSISNLVEKSPVHHLIFDKRKLRSFHQPSMEWYFAIWKPIIKTKGLTNHYKILPELDWFAQSVEAGKHEIFQKYGENIMKGISIKYVKSVDEVIEQLDIIKKDSLQRL